MKKSAETPKQRPQAKTLAPTMAYRDLMFAFIGELNDPIEKIGSLIMRMYGIIL